MALTESVPAQPDNLREPDDRYGWDWTATTHEARDGIVSDLLHALEPHTVLPGKGYQGWPLSVTGFDARGDKLASIYYGGGRDDVHVLATSEPANVVRRRVAVAGQHHPTCPEGCEDFHGPKTARVDTRVDTKTVSFEALEELFREAAGRYNSTITKFESWKGSGDSTGRTLYLGAPSSAIRVRAYEKWLESPGEWQEGTNRVEVQLRPPSRVKAAVSAWGPESTFCASRVTRHLAELLGKDVAEPGSLHIAKPTPTLEQSLEAMGRQYGNRVADFYANGGDISMVLGYLDAKGPLGQ